MGVLSDSLGKKKELGFGQKKSRIKPRSKKVGLEKKVSNPFYDFIHSSGQTCVVCGRLDVVVHHITDIKKISGDRRAWDRVVVLCNKHHDNYSKESIHVLSREEFYSTVMSFEKLMVCSDNIYREYLKGKEK